MARYLYYNISSQSVVYLFIFLILPVFLRYVFFEYLIHIIVFLCLPHSLKILRFFSFFSKLFIVLTLALSLFIIYLKLTFLYGMRKGSWFLCFQDGFLIFSSIIYYKTYHLSFTLFLYKICSIDLSFCI